MNKRILIVEDDLEYQELIQFYLGRTYIVEVQMSGEAALKSLNTRVVDLIIADINVVGMSGFELLATIQNDPGLRKIPVILCSALSDDPTKERALTSGAVGFLPKPYALDALKRMVEMTLAKS